MSVRGVQVWTCKGLRSRLTLPTDFALGFPSLACSLLERSKLPSSATEGQWTNYRTVDRVTIHADS